MYNNFYYNTMHYNDHNNTLPDHNTMQPLPKYAMWIWLMSKFGQLPGYLYMLEWILWSSMSIPNYYTHNSHNHTMHNHHHNNSMQSMRIHKLWI